MQGLDTKRFLTRVEELAAHFLRDIKSISPQGPYFLGGYSFGGLVALEIAQLLRKGGEEVGLLALIAPTTQGPADEQLSPQVSNGGQSSSERFGSRILRHLRHMQELPRGAQVAYFTQCVVIMLVGMMLTPLIKRSKRLICKTCLRLGWMPHVLRLFFIREILISDVYRAASKAYRPERYDGRAVLILAEQDKFDSKVTWTAVIPNGLTSFAVPGDHIGILQVPHVGILAAHVRNCLNQAQQTLLVTKSARPASTRDNIIEFETVHAFERS
jgi:pimeloyl-ACP methyl ester carboxylesterase